MTTNTLVEFQVGLSGAESEASTWNIADNDRITIPHNRELYGITSNQPMRFRTEFSIHLINLRASWQSISIQELCKSIEQRGIHFRFSNIDSLSHLAESIQ